MYHKVHKGHEERRIVDFPAIASSTLCAFVSFVVQSILSLRLTALARVSFEKVNGIELHP